jgi:hypothetical protein
MLYIESNHIYRRQPRSEPYIHQYQPIPFICKEIEAYRPLLVHTPLKPLENHPNRGIYGDIPLFLNIPVYMGASGGVLPISLVNLIFLL